MCRIYVIFYEGCQSKNTAPAFTELRVSEESNVYVVNGKAYYKLYKRYSVMAIRRGRR